MESNATVSESLPRLVHIGEIQFHLGEVTTGGVTPRGRILQHFPLPEGFGIHSEATEGLRAEVLPGGGDHPMIHNNEIVKLNVSVVAKGLNNDHMFRTTSFGVCEWNQLIINMMGQTPDARSTELGEVNAWQVYRINTDSTDYAWLNWACIIGQERLLYEDGRMAKTHMKLFQFLVK